MLSLYAKGVTTGEFCAYFHDIYGAWVSKETISPISDKVIEDIHEWTSWPLGAVAAIFIDAIVVKVRDEQGS